MDSFSGQLRDNTNNPTIPMRCPKCGHRGTFQGVPQNDVSWNAPHNNIPGMAWVGIRECPNIKCRAFVFMVGHNTKIIKTYPPEVLDFDTSNLPVKIISSLKEAIQCHAAGCFRASALMTRRVLEELCEDKGATGKNLFEKLKSLSGIVTLSSDLIDAADELRLLGNDAAHIESKDYDAIEKEEIEAAIDLAKELLKAVYQQKVLVDRLRSLKKAKVP